eukprot:scaffold9353_cov31-Tisochrysis_lutea.AAC.5
MVIGDSIWAAWGRWPARAHVPRASPVGNRQAVKYGLSLGHSLFGFWKVSSSHSCACMRPFRPPISRKRHASNVPSLGMSFATLVWPFSEAMQKQARRKGACMSSKRASSYRERREEPSGHPVMKRHLQPKGKFT